jgi:hypothetical protein
MSTHVYIRQSGPCDAKLGPIALCSACAELLKNDLDPYERYDRHDDGSLPQCGGIKGHEDSCLNRKAS